MRIAALQLCSQSDVSENLLTTERLVEQAARAGAQVVLLPEAFAYMGADRERRRIAEKLGEPGPLQAAVASWCTKWELTVIAGGMPEMSGELDRPFNSSVVFDQQGKLVAVYRKMHLFDVELPDGTLYSESATTTPGSDPTCAEIGERKVGLSICYDLRFPELYAQLRSMGAEVMTVPAAFTRATGTAHWEILLRARAIETQSWVVAAAQEGEHPLDRKTYGHAMIVDPWGKIVTEMTSAGAGFVLAELSVGQAEEVRTRMPVGQHRRLG